MEKLWKGFSILSVLICASVAAETDPLVGTWEIEQPERLLRYYSSGSYYYYSLPTMLNVEKSLNPDQDYLVRWVASQNSDSRRILTFWCKGNGYRFQCRERIEGKYSFDLEFLSETSAEVQNLSLAISFGSRSSNYGNIHGLVKNASAWLKLPTELYEDLKKHASDEKLTVEEWTTRTLKALSDLLHMPGAKGRGATFIIDQSRNYYEEKGK